MHIKLTRHEAGELLKKALGLPDKHTLSFEFIQEQIFLAEVSAETIKANIKTQKLAMIKALRALINLGLAEAKQAIEKEETIQLAELPLAGLEEYKKKLPSETAQFVTFCVKPSEYGEVLDF